MRRLIVVSGAGLSVESGIRAFRIDTASGKAMWDEYDIDEVCNLHSFSQGFRLKTEGFGNNAMDEHGVDFYTKTHNFYNERRVELGTVEPNQAHKQIADWFHRFPGQVLNLTTNVDDLIERAGVPRSEVNHLHGYLKEVIYQHENFGSPKVLVDIGFDTLDPDLFFWAKPNVTFFNEVAPWYRGEIDTFDTLTAQDLVILVGCSNQVINFNWEIFPMLNIGTTMVVVNPSLNYLEQEVYEDRGVLVYRAGAVEAFSNKHFINVIEKHLRGDHCLR